MTELSLYLLLADAHLARAMVYSEQRSAHPISDHLYVIWQ